MKIIHRLIKCVSVILILALIPSKNFAQKDNYLGLLSVKVTVIGKGQRSENKDNFFSLASVTNTQDTGLYICVMTCSWPSNNWLSNNDSIKIHSVACDMNYPSLIKLKPHQTVLFNMLIQAKDELRMKNRSFKLGFIHFKNSSDLFYYLRGEIKRNNLSIYWSNTTKLDDNISTYKLEE